MDVCAERRNSIVFHYDLLADPSTSVLSTPRHNEDDIHCYLQSTQYDVYNC